MERRMRWKSHVRCGRGENQTLVVGDYLFALLNLIALFARSQYEDFKALDPTYQLISNNDGNFNRTFSINKDNSLAVYLLNENRSGEPLEVLP